MYMSNKERKAWMLIMVKGIRNCPPLKEVGVNERDTSLKKWFKCFKLNVVSLAVF